MREFIFFSVFSEAPCLSKTSAFLFPLCISTVVRLLISHLFIGMVEKEELINSLRLKWVFGTRINVASKISKGFQKFRISHGFKFKFSLHHTSVHRCTSVSALVAIIQSLKSIIFKSYILVYNERNWGKFRNFFAQTVAEQFPQFSGLFWSILSIL